MPNGRPATIFQRMSMQPSTHPTSPATQAEQPTARATEAPGGATPEAPAAAPAEGAPVGVTVNGDRRALAAGTTLADLLRAHALDPRLVVVEHNRVILRDRALFESLELRDGDSLELVHFVGGG